MMADNTDAAIADATSSRSLRNLSAIWLRVLTFQHFCFVASAVPISSVGYCRADEATAMPLDDPEQTLRRCTCCAAQGTAVYFVINDTGTADNYTLSLHDALPPRATNA